MKYTLHLAAVAVAVTAPVVSAWQAPPPQSPPPPGVQGSVFPGQLAPGVPMPGANQQANPNQPPNSNQPVDPNQPAGGTAPIGPDGRIPPGVPPGVPFGPPAPSYPPSAPGTGLPPARATPGSVIRKDVPKPVTCDARLALARTDLPYSGGEFAIPVTVTPASCTPAMTLGSPWIRMIDAANFRFQADPNTTTAVRESIVTIGETSFFVRQEPPVQRGLAAAPSRLTFGVNKKGKADTKRITAWSEYPEAAFTARVGHPWLSVTPRKGKKKRQAYEVTVRRNAGLGPGRHDTFVELSPTGSTTATLRIPVVVEVPNPF